MIRRILEKDETGLAALLESLGPLMRYVAAPLLPDAMDVEECLQEAAMRVWEKAGSYQPERGSWKAWVTAITRNTALNMARSAGRAAGTAPLEAHARAGAASKGAAGGAEGGRRAPGAGRKSPFLQKILLPAAHRPDCRRAGHDATGGGGPALPNQEAAAQGP